MPPSATDLHQVNTVPAMPIRPDHVADMMNDLFTAMLCMPFDALPCDSVPISTDNVQASVCVSGDWNAEIRIVASSKLTQRIACAMFAAEPGDLTNEEVQDALGEVANVIGGNAKGIVDRDCSLSLPCVGEPDAATTGDTMRLMFQCDGEPISVCLIEKQL